MNLQRLTTLLCLLITVSLSAQETAPKREVGVNWHGGFLFAHHPDMRHLVQQHFNSVEIYYQRQFSGKKDWHHHYRMPSWGIAAMFMPFPSDALGEAYGASTYYLLPLVQGERFSLNYKLGAGLAMLSERFDRVENNRNNAISTRANVLLQMAINGRLQVHGQVGLNVGLSMTHFSNGAVRKPNLGINFFTLQAGISYSPFTEDKLTPEDRPFEKPRTWVMSLFAGAGVKQEMTRQGDVRPAATVQWLAERRISPKFSYGMGSEINGNANLEIAHREKEIETNALTPYRAGLLASAAFHFGRMAILAQAGGYVFNPGNVDGVVFNRFGLRHEINERWKVNLTLRTHFAKADHFELGMVYQINRP